MDPASCEHFRLTVDEVFPQAAVFSVRISPDGRQVAAVFRRALVATEDGRGGGGEGEQRPRRVRVRYGADVCLLPVDGGPTRPLLSKLGPFGRVSYSPFQGDTSELAIYDEERRLLAAIPVTGGPHRRILARKLSIPHHEIGDDDLAGPRWSPDGQYILVAASEDRQTELLAVSADGGGWRRLLEVNGTITAWDWSPDSQRIVVTTQEDNGREGDVLIVHRSQCEGEPLQVARESHFFYRKPIARCAPDGSLVLRSNRSGWSKLWTIDPSAGTVRQLTHGDWDDGAFQISRDGSIVYASRADQAGAGEDLWIVRPTGGRPERVTRHCGVNAPLGWAGDSILYWHESPTEWGDIWRVSVGDGSTHSVRPEG